MTPAALVQWVAAVCACIVLAAFTVLVVVTVARALTTRRPAAEPPRGRVPGEPTGPEPRW